MTIDLASERAKVSHVELRLRFCMFKNKAGCVKKDAKRKPNTPSPARLTAARTRQHADVAAAPRERTHPTPRELRAPLAVAHAARESTHDLDESSRLTSLSVQQCVVSGDCLRSR